MIPEMRIKFKALSEEDALTIYEKLNLEDAVLNGREIRYLKMISNEMELEDATYLVEEIPLKTAENTDADFDYDGSLDMFDEYIQIQAEFRKGKFRFQNVEEEAYMIGEKKDGKIRMRGADDDEHARFFD